MMSEINFFFKKYKLLQNLAKLSQDLSREVSQDHMRFREVVFRTLYKRERKQTQTQTWSGRNFWILFWNVPKIQRDKKLCAAVDTAVSAPTDPNVHCSKYDITRSYEIFGRDFVRKISRKFCKISQKSVLFSFFFFLFTHHFFSPRGLNIFLTVCGGS